MLKEFIQKIKSLTTQPPSFDPATLDDPIAMQTEWTPAKSGGTNIKTHKLVAVSTSRLEFRASIGAVIFYSIFLIVGLGALLFAPVVIYKVGSGFKYAMLIPVLVGGIFTTVGGCMLYFGTAPIVFDKHKNCFWKGRKSPDEVFNEGVIKSFAKLEDVHALQLISEYCRSDKSSYYSYELNLVLNDGSRLNVIDHGNLNVIKNDTQAISGFLEVPVWDAT